MKKILLICLSLMSLTCHKENWGGPRCKDSNTVKIPQHSLDYFYFKVGSWWVYKCVQTGERDSVWVSEDALVADKYKADKKDCDCGWGKCFHDGRVGFKSSTSERLGKIRFIDYRMAFSGLEEGEYYAELREVFRINDIYPGYKFNFEQINNYVIESELGALIETIDSIKILNKTYTDILKYSFPGNPNPPDWVYEAYYAKNIHLIKYRLHSDNSEWELEKYHIVQ